MTLTLDPPASRFSEFFRHHLRWYRGLRPLWFLFAITIETLVVSLISAFILGQIFHSPGRSDLFVPPTDALFAMCAVAPLWETFYYQLLPMAVLRFFNAPLWLMVVISGGWFMSAHIGMGPEVAIAAGAVGGLYLGFTFAHWLKARGFVMAFGLTTAVHLLNNFFAFCLVFFLGGFDAPAYTRISAPNLDMIYITDTDGSFRCAIASEKIENVFDARGQKIYGPVRLISSHGVYLIAFDQKTIAVNSALFPLAKGRFFYVYFDRTGHQVRQFDLPVDAAQFARDPAPSMQTCLQELSAVISPAAIVPPSLPR